MKLIYCPHCGDMRKLYYRKLTACQCERSWGYYVTEEKAQIGGHAIAFGVANPDIHTAVRGVLPALRMWIYEGERNITTVEEPDPEIVPGDKAVRAIKALFWSAWGIELPNVDKEHPIILKLNQLRDAVLAGQTLDTRPDDWTRVLPEEDRP